MWKHFVGWATLNVFVRKREYASRGGKHGGKIQIRKLMGQNPAESGEGWGVILHNGRYFSSQTRGRRERKR